MVLLSVGERRGVHVLGVSHQQQIRWKFVCILYNHGIICWDGGTWGNSFRSWFSRKLQVSCPRFFGWRKLFRSNISFSPPWMSVKHFRAVKKENCPASWGVHRSDGMCTPSSSAPGVSSPQRGGLIRCLNHPQQDPSTPNERLVHHRLPLDI